MGCASSRPVSHNTTRSSNTRNFPNRHGQAWVGADMLSFDTHYENSFMPKPPIPTARSRSRDPYSYQPPLTRREAPFTSRDFAYQAPVTRREPTIHLQNQYDRQGKSRTQYERGRGVSPPRHRKEMPRRHPSYRYRDVSPLGTSYFEQPFERAYISGVRRRPAMEANFQGGIGGWEVW
ncbi:hypothetical protein SVAN01_00887 [Stagonosporopsis vannaccii]|nr:hypothetical protein SVAN01_00887 [Stagonosporopsis vannaccii]